jgi:hypothetical protein
MLQLERIPLVTISLPFARRSTNLSSTKARLRGQNRFIADLIIKEQGAGAAGSPLGCKLAHTFCPNGNGLFRLHSSSSLRARVCLWGATYRLV